MIGPDPAKPVSRFLTDLPRILERRQEIEDRSDRAGHLLLFLDFDGTLAPLAPRPALAELAGPTRDVLNELAALPAVTISIVSGRSLQDVKGRVGVSGLIYAGNHGLEIEGRGLSFEHPAAVELSSAVRDITGRFAAWSRSLDGIEIEFKGLTTSVHYRRASLATRVALQGLLRGLISGDDPKIEIRAGKMVHEIRPRVPWDKGHAVVWIRDQLCRQRALPIVLGDDLTDENAFTALEDAITVCVGTRRPTAAGYRLDSPDDVRVFLAWLARVWASRHA
jgi:trehalose 6-phosphate phosphatase